ncbi:protein HAIKU1-like [Rutidosis leptorrhynchoides]|uniref:protein HAIKU1-like n=1 Tax=Rutidosis leptorrhynchoides TaxID=125765 RepID=UPI003A996ED0
MNNHDYFGNRHDDRLGVNKLGKSIRKSPPHQPNFANQTRQPTQPPHPPPQPQVYNINKHDFRNIVQQLTGSPLHHSQQPLPRPPVNPSNNNPNNRLQKIRPPSLTPINITRPQLPPVQPGQYSQPPRPGVPFNTTHGARPTHQGQPRAPQVDSPISAYMHYLVDPTQNHPQAHPSFPSPRITGPPTTRPFIPQSPTSQFVFPSPSSYMNLLSPLSQNPLLSPGYQQFPPLTLNFSFSPMGQPGLWGPGPQFPPSPGMGFPSPGFFNFSSPRWRN